ncbi:MAG: carboxypeptidase regulatory-like domain-containing protein, partial [Sedimentisphaerales bacterium]|nr:carboxypeptidase regulatory-like domain-containing protein [Sedimentisphaerales bacterium]
QLSSREDDPDQTYFSFGLKERLYTKDGKFEYNNLPAGKYHITMNSLDENRQYEFPLFHKITLEKDKTTKELIEVIKKQAYYGRVLFEDGTPVYFDPPPWPNGTGRVAVPDQLGFEADYIPIDKDGYFEAFLKDGQYERIKNGEFEMKISIPSLEIERLGQYANISFPPDKLSTDKSNAGTVKIEKQLNERELNPINAPSLLQKEVPDFNGIEINKNSEKEETKNLTIKGYVTDSLGRSRGNVYIAPEATNIWQGIHSDLQGNYILEDIKPEQKKWVAYSQASGVLGLFTIPDNYDGKPIHVTLDYIYASVEGRVVGEQGQGLRGQQVELLLTTKDGITYIFPSSQRTDSQGNYEIGILPFGSGLKIQARLKTTRDEWKKYHTDIIEIPENQIFIQMPTLVIAVGKPEESDDGKVLVSGQILNEDGKPVSGAKVGLYFDMPEYMSTWVKEVITDDSGQWKRRIPKDYSGLNITLTHPEYIKQSWLQFSPEELRNGTNKITMKKGLLLKGIVKNANGEPVENALVDTGGGKGSTPYGEVMENHTTPRTLSDGSFSVGGLAPETINIVVSAFGYAPKNVTLDIVENMKPIDITLNKGKTYTGQVVDANDNPIEAVHIELDEWRLGNNRNSIVNLTQTDSNGIFKMENLPYEGTIKLYYAKSKSGLMGFRKEIPEDYPEIDKVVMYKVPVFTGKVIDAETEKPITKFTLTSGIKSSGFGDSIDWSKYYKEEIISNTGSFEQKWSGYAISYPFVGLCHLRVEADGYLSETAPPITLGQHYEPAVIRMTKGKPFSGTVTDSEGKPIPGADVGWVGPDSKAFINNGKFDQTGYSKQTDIVHKTGLNGEFKLPPSRDKGLIVVVHENNGYASISSDDFENGSQIKLKPWAKIEGTIISSDENRKEYNVLINTAVSDEELSAKKIRWIFDGTSYSRKDFVINYIPSVPVNICQYINSERMKPVYLEPQPGQTYKVELSDKPEIVSGRIIEPKPLEGKVLPKMNDIEISVNNEQLNNGMTLICFWDFEQRPSRNMITQLGKRIQELEKKGISILTINTSDTEQKVMDDWLKEQNINLKVGRITEDAEKTKFNWGVKSLPWLILTDKNHIVIAEGFNLEDLDRKIHNSN